MQTVFTYQDFVNSFFILYWEKLWCFIILWWSRKERSSVRAELMSWPSELKLTVLFRPLPDISYSDECHTKVSSYLSAYCTQDDGKNETKIFVSVLLSSHFETRYVDKRYSKWNDVIAKVPANFLFILNTNIGVSRLEHTKCSIIFSTSHILVDRSSIALILFLCFAVPISALFVHSAGINLWNSHSRKSGRAGKKIHK